MSAHNTHEVIVAGFGGQGVMSMGQLLAYAGMLEGKHVTYVPSYGPEMRGGTANCMVVLSDGPVGSPVVSEPTAAIVMNKDSMARFEKTVKPGGILIYNSSLIDQPPGRKDLTTLAVPVNDIANELGNARVGNMVALGAFIELSGAVAPASVVGSLKKSLPAHRHSLIPLNEQALARGAEVARSAGAGGR